MTTQLIPVDAIDPVAALDRWTREFEHHLDLLPPVMDAIVTATIPHIRANQTDKIVVTGGGPVDNMTAFLRGIDTTEEGRLVDGGAAADARHLWGMVVEYAEAVTAWEPRIEHRPTLTPRPNADPLTARSLALTTAGWLIQNAALIEPIHELDDYREALFTLIRRLRGRYGVAPFTRRPRAFCTTCGTRNVTITWIDNPNGSPKPVRAGKCGSCGQTYQDTREPADEPSRAPRAVLSPACADLMHELCQSINCECPHHTGGHDAVR